MADKKTVMSFVYGSIAGAVTGAVAALLFAPKAGRELRQDISATAGRVGGKTADIGRQAGSAVQTLARQTADLASTTKQAATRFVSEIRTRSGQTTAAESEVAAAAEQSDSSEADTTGARQG